MTKETTAKIELTEQEANVIIQLLDIATKSWWLQVAQSALVFVWKLQNSFKDLSIEKKWTKND